MLVMGLAFAGAAKADDFKGFYVGGNLGASIARANAATTTVFSPTGYFATTSVPAIATAGVQKIRPTGFMGGGQVGYNFQAGSIVLGFEVDFGAMKLNDSRSTTATYPCCAPTTFTVNQSVKTDWLFTARPRLGFVSGRWMLYGTGGLALTNLNYQEVFTDTFATAHENGGVKETRTGWTAGGGVEYELDHIILRGEYLYSGFGRVSATSTNFTAFSPPIAFPTNVFTHTTNLHSHIIRAGISFRF
jgi:outer membrane immunogenic protein